MPPSFAEIAVEGPDASAFLHAQLAADIQSIASGCWCFAAYCMPDGRVQALMMAAREAGDRLRLLLPDDIAEAVHSRLLRYRLRAKCSLTLSSVVITALAAEDREISPDAHAARASGSREYRCEACNWRTSDGGPTPIAGDLWAEQIALDIPWIVAATSEQFLPQMLALEQLAAFSLRKGCFPGQEIVARTHYLGRSKRRLVNLTRSCGESTLSAGSTLMNALDADEACGWLLADAYPYSTGALAVVTESAAAELVSAASTTSFVINRETTETKGDKLLNGRYFTPSGA